MNILIDMVCHGHGQAGYLLDEILHTINEGHFSSSKFLKYGNARRILGPTGARLFALLTGGNFKTDSSITTVTTPPSAPYNYSARKAAANVTRILKGKNLRNGFFQLHIVDEADRRSTLAFMAEFLRYKRSDYGFVAFFIGDKVHEIWITRESRVELASHPDGIIERATEMGCSSIIVGYSHSGRFRTLGPSQEDYQVKRALASRLERLSIAVEGYIFIRGRYVSC